MMFEDLVLQSIRYDGDTITLTVPDYLPESQRWANRVLPIGTLIKIMILRIMKQYSNVLSRVNILNFRI